MHLNKYTSNSSYYRMCSLYYRMCSLYYRVQTHGPCSRFVAHFSSSSSRGSVYYITNKKKKKRKRKKEKNLGEDVAADKRLVLSLAFVAHLCQQLPVH